MERAFRTTQACPLRAIELAGRTTEESPPISFVATEDRVNRLSDDLSLLRGVHSSTLLQSRGKLLRCPTLGWQYSMSKEEADRLYNKSHPVEALDWFISHSWHDPRWIKYMCILLVLNWRPMVVCLHCVPAVWLVMVFMGVPVPTFSIHFILGEDRHTATFGIVLPLTAFACIASILFAHKLKPISRDRVLFLDKVCIHQLDPVRKAAGIAKLGGFLRHSKRMLVLWSPGYFSRLWCAYELACFAALSGFDRIDFVPWFTPAMVCLSLSIASISMMVLAPFGAHGFFVDDLWSGFWPYFFSAIGFCLGAGHVYVEQELAIVCKQIKSFTLADAKCYCCSVAHSLPGSNETIPCDREFVESHIRSWFAELARAGEGDGIEAFERNVREVWERPLRCRWLRFFFGLIYYNLTIAIWLCLEMSMLTSSLAWPLLSVISFTITVGCICVLPWLMTTLILRKLLRSVGNALSPWQSLGLRILTGFFTGTVVFIIYRPYGFFWWQRHQEPILLSSIAAVAASVVALLVFLAP